MTHSQAGPHSLARETAGSVSTRRDASSLGSSGQAGLHSLARLTAGSVSTLRDASSLGSSGQAGLDSLARLTAGSVVDPEMPMLSLDDLGVLREVEVDGDRVVVTLTPTYSGCPALATMRDDVVRALEQQGFPDVEVRISLSPAWSSDWISQRGRAALHAHGLSAPGPVAAAPSGTATLTLGPTRRRLDCPRCGSAHTELTSEFGPTACTALYRCTTCLEPFEHVKEH